jgi:leucyl-tRNA---protein transferase
MGTDPGQHADDFRLFQTTEHACGYWADRVARDLVFDPRDPRMKQWYPLALGWGFRRSGDIVYRPHCAHCRACVAVRIPIARFQPDRSQRRCLARNRHVEMRVLPAERTDEQLALYRRYLAARHAGGGMDGHGAAEFDQFLVGSWSEGRFIELREHAGGGHASGEHASGERGNLLAVAVTDIVDGALSAVYTFYDPDLVDRGLGTLAILKQIEWGRSTGRTHLYLGYWINGHRKMDYKRRFRPLEGFDGREWRELELGDSP